MICFDADKIMDVLSHPAGTTEGMQNSKIIYRMLWSLYQRQESDEKEYEATVHHNNVGFNGVDARFLSSVARGGQKFQNLTLRQAVPVAKALKKYLNQLIEIANEKQPIKAAIPKRGKKKNEAQTELFQKERNERKQIDAL